MWHHRCSVDRHCRLPLAELLVPTETHPTNAEGQCQETEEGPRDVAWRQF
ncbi:hypothetical protein NP493_164g03045 [Ridgeia piscesae]|uniref:Uncharacterized protein n=1 Tax=Ridgeia piscesae TaxID=27915 RepID=A0AAD9P3J6_RIDPI|nr:hypothetical protein NP493_164g03045 [Ridgeia piscesae]